MDPDPRTRRAVVARRDLIDYLPVPDAEYQRAFLGDTISGAYRVAGLSVAAARYAIYLATAAFDAERNYRPGERLSGPRLDLHTARPAAAYAAHGDGGPDADPPHPPRRGG